MNEAEFFEKLDCYLISDLKNMDKIDATNSCGGCGYPLLQTLFSGIELLGIVMSGKRKANAFYFFIDNYMSEYSSYKETIYRGIRHSVNHYYLTTGGLYVYKDDIEGRHLMVEGKKFHINSRVLLNDFLDAYKKLKDKLLVEKEEKSIVAFKLGFSKLMEDFETKVSTLSKYLGTEVNLQREMEENMIRGNVASGASFSHYQPSGTDIALSASFQKDNSPYTNRNLG